ncbi:MAG: alpha/beta hydrolase [Marinibacterium sp.]|nr:alpha/beta hydrolase [Marinibacterium sp.]
MPHFTTSDGLRLYFEDSHPGDTDATPLLCLPGLTRNCRDFDPLKAQVPQQRLIAMDYRGRGRSSYDVDFHNYNILRERRDAIELLDHLGLGRVTVLGTSRGGLVAMAMAASDRDRLSGVILNDVGPVVDPKGISRIMAYLGNTPAQSDYDSCARALHDAMQPQFPDVPLAVWRRQAEIQFDEVQGRLELRYDAHLRRAILEAAASDAAPDLWVFFDALRDLPLGLIRGENSDVLNTETTAQMQARCPDMIVTQVPNRGHAPFLDEPQSLELIGKIMKIAA